MVEITKLKISFMLHVVKSITSFILDTLVMNYHKVCELCRLFGFRITSSTKINLLIICEHKHHRFLNSIHMITQSDYLVRVNFRHSLMTMFSCRIHVFVKIVMQL